jgi:phospholipid N-methyltransferase
MKPESLERLQGLRLDIKAATERAAFVRQRFAALQNRKEEGTAPTAVSSFNLIQNPATIAARMAQMIAGEAPGRVLEPSAGLGRLYRAMRETPRMPARIVMVEESPECCAELRRQASGNEGDRVFNSDFLNVSAFELGGEFEAVCMNPPFKMGTDIRHILHAFGMLSPGGLLVSLCYNGVRQSAKLKPLCATWELLPEGSFKSEGTGAEVVLLTMRKELQSWTPSKSLPDGV